MQVHTSAPKYLEWNAQRKTVFPNKYVHLESLRQAALCGYGYGLCPVMVWWVSHSRCYDLMGVTSMLLMAHVYCHMNLAKSASSEWIYLIPETFGKFCKWHHWRFVKPVRWGGAEFKLFTPSFHPKLSSDILSIPKFLHSYTLLTWFHKIKYPFKVNTHNI